VTSGLTKRLFLHREDVIGGFTQKYGVHRLVWFEEFEDMPTAITREKQIKKWNRAWKLRLIESHNPQWRDLWEEIVRFLGSRPRLKHSRAGSSRE